ncbi:transmembrane 9 superfamily member 4-like [Plasmopara halstedii]|uniref:Transmembrane 9 superfamily member n=1 Tax=Plasmopara halstedii TaxID=4781 RepID=A0A0P1AEU1_PLAHL|nr:transmembrane 9 superfamily member 4-like [Plasmopara halstedii]CEG39454.1 transmembrane 9 superfamily member 4-like [Plasmopara halstedii]|eukprot:XP_024575823.1 transmembrane 9 superfamily member 4-like [Plasmopara halstedii]
MQTKNILAVSLAALLAMDEAGAAFYVPGVAPESWAAGETVHLNVNKITSTKTLMPYEYYYLPYCKPAAINEQQENLGEIMAGDTIMDSLYNLQMEKDAICQVLCKPMKYTPEQSKLFIDMIKDEYYVQWIVDNLPVLYRDPTDSQQAGSFKRGFPVGEVDEDGKYLLYNHVRIIISVNPDPYAKEDGDVPKWRIVGFEAVPTSIQHTFENEPMAGQELDSATCGKFINIEEVSQGNYQYLNPAGETTVLYTYDVQFIKSDIVWEERWDRIISSKSSNDQIHWFSIINSLMIVLFLTGMIAMIMLRTLHRDIARYNEVQTTEEAQEESGWKLVHGDVFRPPQLSPMLFSVVVGTGVQVCCMSWSTMVIALLGLLSPANRGSLLTTLLLLFVFMGSFAGYSSSRTYKMFNGKDWKKNTILTAVLYPGLLFGVFFLLNLVLWGKESSQAVPFGTLFALLVLWFGISVPLVFLGSYFGFKAAAIEQPVRTNQIARQIPEQVWYLSSPFSILVGGILPFGAVFIELFFIMSALWLHQIYYVFGFLFIVLLILVATCAEVTVVMCYFQLCAEDYRWWWRSFLTSGSAAVYLFLYSFLYFFTKLNITAFVSGVLYFGYMFLISVTFFFLTGTIGYLACLWFTRKIYGSIKID